MGDISELYDEDWDDDYDGAWDGHRFRQPRCNRCGSEDVYWRQIAVGRWQLMATVRGRFGTVTATQQPHRCPVDLDAFPDLTE